MFLGAGLQDHGVVVEVVVGSLLQICAGFGGDFYPVTGDGVVAGRARPGEGGEVHV